MYSAAKPVTEINNHNGTNNYDYPLLLCGPPYTSHRAKWPKH